MDGVRAEPGEELCEAVFEFGGGDLVFGGVELEDGGGENGAVDDLEDADAEPVVVASDLAGSDAGVLGGEPRPAAEGDDLVTSSEEFEREGLEIAVGAAADGRAVPDVGPVDEENPHSSRV